MSTEQPLVSVIVPCYNHAEYVINTLDSIINNYYKNVEIIIIDDGSTDESPQLIAKWVEQHKYEVAITFRARANKGLVKTHNELLSLANGKYYTLLASDDFLLPNGIESRVKYLEDNMGKKAVFADCIVVDSYNNELYSSAIEEMHAIPKSLFKENLKRNLILYWCIPGPVFLADTKYIKENGMYNEQFLIEDRYLYLKLLSQDVLGFVDEFVSAYRWHNRNTVRLQNSRVRQDLIDTEMACLELFTGEDRIALEYSLSKNFLHKGNLTIWDENYHQDVYDTYHKSLFVKGLLDKESEYKQLQIANSLKYDMIQKQQYPLHKKNWETQYDKAIYNINKYMHLNNMVEVLYHLQFALRYANEFDLTTQQFMEFQRVLNVLKMMFSEQPNLHIDDTTSLIVLSEYDLYDNTTKLLLKALEQQHNKSDIVLTEIIEGQSSKELRNIQSNKLTVKLLEQENLFKKIDCLNMLIHNYKKVICVVSSADVISYMALLNISKPMLVIDKYEKKFWIGSNIIDSFKDNDGWSYYYTIDEAMYLYNQLNI